MKTKILIVDDIWENIVALSSLIEAEDVEIHTAQTPDEALNHILDHDFGLALLDVQMPVMSGFELARIVRGVERGKHLPIIFVTAQTSESRLLFEGYESGAVDVLFKPMDPYIVRSKVRVFVQLDSQSRQLASQVDSMSRLKEEAESANEAKSRFLANMSHEIRTPLSAVLGFAEVLSQKDLPSDDRTECLASIARNGKLLIRIIDDILDISKIEARKVEIERTEFDLVELLGDLESTLQPKAQDKNIALTFSRDPSGQGRFISDPLRIKQILLNIIGNAIKFTKQGSVGVMVTIADDGRIIFTIEDTGIGIAKNVSEKLFLAFAQADSSTRRKYGGTGLGLAISKQFARSLGGDVELKSSTLGVGSIFEVSIAAIRAEHAKLTIVPDVLKRVAAASAPPPLAKNSTDLKGKSILVVDDVVDNRMLVECYLKPLGCLVTQAGGGQEALDKVGGARFDAILMDIQMPLMDGYETTQRLREGGFKRPIIALTAHAMKEELDKCLRAGCDTTLTKPISKRDLIDHLTTSIC